MAKCSKSLKKFESIVRAALRSAGAPVSEMAIAPAQGRNSNWAFLRIDRERVVDPAIEDLMRALQVRYELAW